METVNAAITDPTGPEPEQQTDRLALPVDAEQPPRLAFPVVGIGASAGGLAAVSEFISTVRADSGMAFVLVQHLPPTGESMLVEIFSKRTTIPVMQVEQGMTIQANHIYVIRPGRTLTMKEGAFQLGERLERPMGNRPIDDFFRSLAEEQRERGIGIIMSGMGSNGAAGCQAIKAVGGMCIAQDPETAEFPSMPRHLIDAGYADYILGPKDMSDVLLGYVGHPYASGARDTPAALAKPDQQYLREILAVLRTRTRQDFQGYKKPTVLRRIQRRMGLNRITDLADYARLLRQNNSELTSLADDLLIHVTGFFRDPEAWEALRQRVIVPLIAVRQPDESIRCWVTACSSGEEAYTLAMLLVEEAERTSKRLDIKVFATDMAERSLQNARGGIYPGGIESEIDPQRLDRFFQREDAVYRVRQELRERVVFAPQNVLQDPPFSRLDIITCRNLLIYLEPEMQQRILTLLHFGLREGATLFLGTSETTGGTEDMFEPIDKKARIYRRIGPTRHGTVQFPLPHAVPTTNSGRRAPAETQNPGPRPTMAQMSQRTLLEHHTPPAVTIDRDYRIVYYHGNTEPFIASPRGEPTRDLLQLARDNVRGAVRIAVQRAASQNAAATALDGWVEHEPGHRLRVAVVASPLDGKNAPDYLVVSFHERAEPAAQAGGSSAASDGPDSGRELQRVRDELQSTIEELQTSNEELKASHEEVVSTNEELQSTNEELETSREEMQSLNEELSTVNSQLHAKMEEHQAAHNDLASLLTSTDLAVLFLDTHFLIRRFTPQLRELLEVIASDVGRPLSDLAKKFDDPDLTADVEAVLTKLVPREKEIMGRNDRWFLRRVTPYRTADNRIDGVVIAFIDITARRNTEAALRASEEQFRRAIEEAPVPVIMQAENGEVLQISRMWTDLTGYTLAEVPTFDAWLSRATTAGAQILRSQVQELLSDGKRSLETEFTLRARDGSEKRWSFSASSPGTLRDGRRFIVGMAVDITARYRAEADLRESEERFRLLVEGARDSAMIMLDTAGRITAWNAGAERLLGYDANGAVGMDASVIFTPEDRAAGVLNHELARVAATGQAKDERQHIRKSGELFWGSGTLTALYHPDGALRGFVWIMRDETVRKAAEDALQAAKDASEAANRMKDEFLATLSHELRTPLSAILLWSKILQKAPEPRDQEQLREGLAAIKNSAEAQKTLIEDLLDVTRITTGKLRLQMRDMELLPLVRDSVDAIAPTAQAKNVTVSSDLQSDAVIVHADPDRLRQIIWNLLTNAVKFTPAGGRVEVKVRREQGSIEISVADTGKGIQADFLPHVFERFRQADASHARTSGGIGLGLAIARQLAELHGGTISAQSLGINKGATFFVRLPAPQTKPASVHRPADAKTSAGLVLHGVKALIVEDEPENRSALAMLLRQAGMVVAEAGSAAAALKSYEQSPPEVILSDLGLPGEDGCAFLRQIRKQEATAGTARIPAIALTAFAQDADRARAIDAGFQKHLSKPVEPQHLLNVLQEALRPK